MYTDASLDSCIKKGGVAVTTETCVLHQACVWDTVTRLEGLAILEALYLAWTKYAQDVVVICTDAEVWSKRYAQLPYLVMNHWRKPNGVLAKEIDILTIMWRLHRPEKVRVMWVPGHTGVIGNVLAHYTAREATCGRVSPMRLSPRRGAERL